MINSLAWNLLLTAALALVLAAGGRLSCLRRRPALRHTLWLLVLAKLITPPLIPVPLLPPAALTASSADVEAMVSPAAFEIEGEFPNDNSSVAEPSAAVDPLTVETQKTKSEATNDRWRVSHFYILTSISLIGTVLLVTTHTVRATKMNRWVRRFGHPASTLDRTCRVVSARLGIRGSVRSCVVDARTVPLLWGWWRPMIVVPRQLVDRLDEEPLRCIVAHELAHYARRDHWSNLFALWIKAFFWWYPVTWLAHREIRAAQESCCDAIAIDCADTTRHNYATTLLKALDFLQPESSSHWKLAVQMGSRSSLLQRFEMIGNTQLTYHVSHRTIFTLFVFMLPLFCLPVRSQEKQSPDKVVVGGMLGIDETPTEPNEPQGAVTAKVDQFAGQPEHLFLVGIVRQGKPSKSTAWVTDRTTKKQVTLEDKSTFRVGKTLSTIESMSGDTVTIRIDNKRFRWKLGQNFRDVIASQPESVVAKKDGKLGDALKGELAGGSLSGSVQMQLFEDKGVMVLRGNSEDVKRLAKLMATIDQQRLESPAEKVKAEEQVSPFLESYRVAPLASQTVLDVLQTLLAGKKEVRMAVDAKTGNLIVLGSNEVHETIKEVLKAIKPKATDDLTVAPQRDETRFRFAFRQQPWNDVLEWFAETAELSLVTDTAIPGTFNYQDKRIYTVAEATDLLNSVLLTKGFAMIARDRMLYVIDLEDGIPAALVPRVKVEDLRKRGKFELISVLLPIGDEDAEQIRQEVQPLLGRHGQVTAMPRSGMILVTDRAGVVRAVHELLDSKRDQ